MLLSLSLFALALASPVQEPSNPRPRDTFDLSFAPLLRRPQLLEVSQEFKGNFTVVAGGQRTERETESKVEMDLVDELTHFDGQKIEGTRTFLKAFKVTDGELQDPPLNGLTIEMMRVGDQSWIDLNSGRYLPKSDADGLVRAVPSTGLWLSLPKEAKLRHDSLIDLESLGALLLSNDVQHNSGSVNALFESYDAATGIAKLSGPAHLREQGSVQGLDMTLTYECDCALEINTKEQRITAISISGSYTAEGASPDGSVRFEGQGRYRAGITTQIGDAVAKARQRPIRFRDRTFRADSLGVCLTLPSCYGRVEEQGSSYSFQRMLKGNHVASVCVDYLDGDSSDPQAFFDWLLADLKKQYGRVSIEKVSSPLGAGRAYQLSRRIDGVEIKVRSEVYPLGKRFLLLKLEAEPDTLPTTLPDFTKARKSLARLETKP
jgi:hypothetical protein